jgi:hypothetical protein
MFRDENAGRIHNVKTDSISFDGVDHLKYLGKTLTHQNSILEEIKNSLQPRNSCYHSVQHLLSSSLLSKNVKIKTYKTIILPVMLYGCETWSLTMREERRVRFLKVGCFGDYVSLRGRGDRGVEKTT